MKKLLDLLDKKEQRIIGFLLLFLIASLVFYVLVARAEKNRFSSQQNSLSTLEESFQQRESKKTEREQEWKKWEQTVTDMKELRESFFYREEDVVLQMRRDLQKIFLDAGIAVPALNYDYEDFEEENIKKVKIKFDISGPYFSLKKFIHALERLKKFLVIERIDFVSTEAQSSGFRLSVFLAGYYEGKA
jgi:Tfp pilus assembly protein PilO